MIMQEYNKDGVGEKFFVFSCDWNSLEESLIQESIGLDTFEEALKFQERLDKRRGVE